MAHLKAVLLAAGIGKRLQPLTNRVPKPLLDVAGKPMIEHTIRFMLASGVTEFAIVINAKYQSAFGSALRNVTNDGASITYIHQNNPTGMSDAICTARDFTGDDFIVCAGDMLVPLSHVRDMIRVHLEKKPLGTLSVLRATIDYVPGLGNVKVEDNGTITGIIEKPAREQLLSNNYSLPFYIFNKHVFSYLERCPLSIRGERELQDALGIALKEGMLLKGVAIDRPFSSTTTAFMMEVACLNITNPTDYFNASISALEGKGIMKPPDILCTMIEPVMIGDGCDISDDCLLGPNVIVGRNVVMGALAEVSNAIVQDKCTIGKASFIEHAIIMEGARIEDGAIIKGKAGVIKIVEA